MHEHITMTKLESPYIQTSLSINCYMIPKYQCKYVCTHSAASSTQMVTAAFGVGYSITSGWSVS